MMKKASFGRQRLERSAKCGSDGIRPLHVSDIAAYAAADPTPTSEGKTTTTLDSRIISPNFLGIHVGSSQIVNVVLFL